MSDDLTRDPFARLRQATRARIGLGRSGAGLPTSALASFRLDAARARDAVHAPLDVGALQDELSGFDTLALASAAADRSVYLRRPDLGRKLSDESRSALREGGYDLAFVICDGLSSAAVQAHAGATLRAAHEALADLSIAPVAIVTQGRVAVGDEIGQGLGARMVAVLIGERPGLTVADSLGIYLTHNPQPGCPDSDRNCLSNIHLSGGQTPVQAASKLAWLVREARRRGLTGTKLKEEAPSLAASEIMPLPERPKD
ncbi:ethanolamine ammonia-lyase subunit EutC [Thioclava sp. GXIMD4216]|uniref:ethanolamine ammonia-lyase subunit EutC n=1 Tax=Thioclava sp. GXIMD4216 TaxID=3131929 RepID=UPI0030CA64B4